MPALRTIAGADSFGPGAAERVRVEMPTEPPPPFDREGPTASGRRCSLRSKLARDLRRLRERRGGAALGRRPGRRSSDRRWPPGRGRERTRAHREGARRPAARDLRRPPRVRRTGLPVARVERAETRPVLAPSSTGTGAHRSTATVHPHRAACASVVGAGIAGTRRLDCAVPAGPAGDRRAQARRRDPPDLARVARFPPRSAPRGGGWSSWSSRVSCTERDGGRYGLTPEGHRRVRRR